MLSVAFSPDRRRLAAGGQDGTVSVYDAASRRIISKLRGSGRPIYSVAFSPSSRLLATGGQDATITLWDPVTRRRGNCHGEIYGLVVFVPQT
ncbi:MAG: WD40 repeat domain-containing protein, partial [Mycobacterium leprae]